ncbi:MAG: hypothetical protein DMG64_15780 [Acidobacteria bacterium]|nr:MAG: hypothetical protein DMG64_15780 [Acidobacteriota bacterium]
MFFVVPAVVPGQAQTADHFFNSNGVKIRYLMAGKGEPVLLIHPFAASAEIWEPVTKDLAQNYQVIAMDCRGHGKSEKPHDPKQYGIEMVNDVVPSHGSSRDKEGCPYWLFDGRLNRNENVDGSSGPDSNGHHRRQPRVHEVRIRTRGSAAPGAESFEGHATLRGHDR